MNSALKLADIQRRLARSIKTGDDSSLTARLIREAPERPVSERLDVYQDAYRIRMIESLRDDFTRVVAELGEDRFKELAEAYLAAHPSTYASLAEFSENFPEFLKLVSPSQFRSAALDWIEIAASYARGIDRMRLLSVNEIQAGATFQIIRNPTLQIVSVDREILIAYRSADEIVSQPLLSDEGQVLVLVDRPMDLDALMAALEKNQIDTTVALPIISDWMKREILYCERTLL